MGTSRRQYMDEFKREAVGLLASSGRPLSQISQELGIAPSRLRAWRNRDEGVQAGSPRRPNTHAAIPPAGADLAAENAHLRRENERLHMEREILKKRCAFSRKRRDEISSYRGSARYLQGSCHVRCAGHSPAGYYACAAAPRAIGRRSTVPCWPRSVGSTRHIAGDTARPGFTRPCAPRGIRRAAVASNGSCVITASGHECDDSFGCALVRAIEECFLPSARQRCLAYPMRNLAAKASTDLWPELGRAPLPAIRSSPAMLRRGFAPIMPQ
jgi:transposase